MAEQFIVVRQFIYKDKKLKPGSVWEPEGCRNDDTIISCGALVRRVKIKETKRPSSKRYPKKEEVTA